MRASGGPPRARLVVPLAWIAWLAAAPLIAQAPAGALADGAPRPGGGEPSAQPVRIDAIVTDASGRRVLTLLPADFEVRVNGAVQPLAGLEVRTPPRARTFAFFLDEYHVTAGPPADRLRESLLRFVDSQLRPADRVAVLKPLQPVGTARFTTDRTALREAILAFGGRKGDLAARSPFEEQFIGHAPSAVAAARSQIVTVSLTELAVQLGDLQAERAALVVISEGFQPAGQAMSRRQGRLPDLQGIVRAADRFNFSLYALSPSEEDDRAAARLASLAGQTGGLFAAGSVNFEQALGQIAADLDGYYELQLPPPSSDGRFHAVEVKARRSGLSVRTRQGYWAPLSSEVRALLGRPLLSDAGAPRRVLRRSSLIDAWVGLRPAPDRHDLELVLSWIATAPGPSGRPGDPAFVALTARTDTGESLFEGRIGRAGGAGGAPAVARFPAPAGRIELDIRVLGAGGEDLDTDVRDVYVPDLRAGPPLALLPPEILRARTVPEYRRLLEDPAPVPTPLRAFSRSERLVVRTPAWQASGGPLSVGATVLNRRGQPMRRLEPLPVTVDGVHGFDLPLAWLAPGDYYVEVSVGDGERLVGERILFRVTR